MPDDPASLEPVDPLAGFMSTDGINWVDPQAIPDEGRIPAYLVPDPVARIQAYMKRFHAGHVKADTMMARLCGYQHRCEQGVWHIRDVHQKKIPLKPRLSQAMYSVAAFDQAADGQPIRIRILKARKTGISTDVQERFVDSCTYYENQVARTIAHEKGATRDIFRIGRYAAKTHCGESAKVLKYEITWPGMGSEYSCATAGGTAVGAGSTPNLLHISEGPKHGGNKHSTRYNSVTAVPDVAESMIIEEFTAKGRDEYFVSWSEAFADPTHPYKAIFIPWFADAECQYPIEVKRFWRDDYEQKLADRARKMGYELSNEQLEWRRRKIKGMPGGEVIFRQEYPSSPEEAVMGADGLIVRNLRDCLVTELPFDKTLIPHDELVGGIDFGYADPCVIWSGVYRDRVLWLTNFYRKSKGLARDHVLGLIPHCTYYCDPPELQARKQLQEESEKHGLDCRFIAAPRKRGPGEDVAGVELRVLIDMITNDRLKIMVGLAPQLICEADTFSWNEKTGKPVETRSDITGHFDTIYALKYLAMGVMNREQRIYVPSSLNDDRDYRNRREELLACA
jgi:hypothetical protein